MRINTWLNSFISPLGVEIRRRPPKDTLLSWNWQSRPSIVEPEPQNPLGAYFERHRIGPGIWKWKHYFDIYHRHLSPFRDKTVSILEIGVYSGGGLSMWADYFGPKAMIYGVDIEPACQTYASDQIRISIGDQGDRAFWRGFKKTAPSLDVVIDDGSHMANDQVISFEELFPHLRAGGVYICEDIHQRRNPFMAYAAQ